MEEIFHLNYDKIYKKTCVGIKRVTWSKKMGQQYNNISFWEWDCVPKNHRPKRFLTIT